MINHNGKREKIQRTIAVILVVVMVLSLFGSVILSLIL